MAVERLACFGERETPRCTVDQAHAKLALQRSDAAAKLRRLQAQRLRRRGIGAEIGDLGEEIEIVEVSNRGHGQPQLFYPRQICVLFRYLSSGLLRS